VELQNGWLFHAAANKDGLEDANALLIIILLIVDEL
jgi:hypothetical protein